MPEINHTEFRTELRSEEMQEIVGKPPGFFIRWGAFLFSSIIFLLLLSCWFYKYQEKVNADFELKMLKLNYTEVAFNNGEIIEMKKLNGFSVLTGDTIAIFGNRDSIIKLRQAEKKLSTFRQKLSSLSTLPEILPYLLPDSDFSSLNILIKKYNVSFQGDQTLFDEHINKTRNRENMGMINNLHKVKEAVEEIYFNVKQRESRFYIISKAEGIITWPTTSGERPKLQKDASLFTISSKDRFSGLIKIDPLNKNKIVPKQAVYCELTTNDPQNQVILKGYIDHVSEMAADGKCVILVNFRSKENPNLNHADSDMLFDGMKGTAEIVVGRKRLIHKLLPSFGNGN